MEFPTIGNNCVEENCNQLDFLPLQCQCSKYFCREHFLNHCSSGKCELAPKPKSIEFTSKDIFVCSSQKCSKGSFIEMPCTKCQKHYCIEHRFHPECPEVDPDVLAAGVLKIQATKEEYVKAKERLDLQLARNLRMAILHSPAKAKTAAKVHLMRLKQKAIGAKSIPTKDRIYFAITKPTNDQMKTVTIVDEIDNSRNTLHIEFDMKDKISVFVSRQWSIGRAMDAICELCNVKNDNNITSSYKLRLFRQFDGYCINPKKMDVTIEELMKNEILSDGDNLIIEYLDNETLGKLNDYQELCIK